MGRGLLGICECGMTVHGHEIDLGRREGGSAAGGAFWPPMPSPRRYWIDDPAVANGKGLLLIGATWQGDREDFSNTGSGMLIGSQFDSVRREEGRVGEAGCRTRGLAAPIARGSSLPARKEPTAKDGPQLTS